jgi:hypothetical protein
MEVHERSVPPTPNRTPWNKGKLIGAKPPLWPKHVWSIRTKLQIEERIRDLALFNADLATAAAAVLPGVAMTVTRRRTSSAASQLTAGLITTSRRSKSSTVELKGDPA